MPIRKSMSGSALMAGRQVYGILAQATSPQTALALPSELLVSVARKLIKGPIPRHYSVDIDSGHLLYHGLRFKLFEVADGGLSGSLVWGHIHEDKTEYVSNETRDFDFLEGEAFDLNTVRALNPLMAKELESSRTKTVYIRAIGGLRVRTLRELMRVASECKGCVIDEFIVPGVAVSPAQGKDPYSRLFGYVNSLLAAMVDPSKATHYGLVLALQNYSKLLVQYKDAYDTYRALSPDARKRLTEQWSAITELLTDMPLTDEAWGLIGKIMEAQTQIEK
jgi:hypothetical protein